tara:strand:- start:310 stop:1467 length:1158 start_codon:yes stop_codon:yes gene_type:complete
MRKILFVTTRNPFSKKYSGDRLRSSQIIKYLSKKNKVDMIYIDELNNETVPDKSFKGNKFFFKRSLFLSLINSFLQLFKINPLQLGFFYSEKAHKFIENQHNNYDVIIFHLLRSTKHMPSNFTGKKILEMTDVYSDNYKQTFNQISFLNPLLYLYFLEYLLIKNYEKKCSDIFDKIVLVDNNNLNKSKHIFKDKVVKISNGSFSQKKIFIFKKKNNKILFIGNIKYLPNKEACFYFVKKILPKINKKFPEIEFHIIGEISILNKVILMTYKNVKVLGTKKNLNNLIKNSICGISNLNIATGMQNKILNYMSYGIPTICSFKSFNNSVLKKNKDLLVYKNDEQLINLIFKLKTNKSLSNKISNNGYKKVKTNFNWDLVLKKYSKII